jgi:hypothetical protein
VCATLFLFSPSPLPCSEPSPYFRNLPHLSYLSLLRRELLNHFPQHFLPPSAIGAIWAHARAPRVRRGRASHSGFFVICFFFSSLQSPSCIREASPFAIHSISLSLSAQPLPSTPTLQPDGDDVPASGDPALRSALLDRCPCFGGGCSGGLGSSRFREEGPSAEVIGRCDTRPKPFALHGSRLPSRGAGWERRSSRGEVCTLNPTPPHCRTCSRIPCSLGW